MTTVLRRVVVAACASVLVAGYLTAVVGAHEEESGDREYLVTFTKWVTINPGYPIMAGVTGGDAAGTFTGQVFEATPTTDGLIERLVAVYEVHSGSHSFNALIEGGSNSQGDAILDGRVLSGWLAGARVQVRFKTISCSEPNALFGTCFQGTILLRADDE